MIVALVFICGLAVPVPDCNAATALLMTERADFPQEWCLDDPNAGTTSAQISRLGNYEKIVCDWREPLPAIEPEDLERGGPR
jgi:hypothetical protein